MPEDTMRLERDEDSRRDDEDDILRINQRLQTEIKHRERVQTALTQRARELAALYETALEISGQMDLSSLLYSIVHRACDLVGAGMGGLYMIKPDSQLLELVVSYKLPGDLTGTIIDGGEGLAGRVAQTGEPFIVEDYQNWEGRSPHVEGIAFRRALGVPLTIKRHVIGVITVTDDDRPGSFSEEDVRLVSLFADQAAIAIENARLYEKARREITERERTEQELRNRNRDLMLLHRAISAATSTLEPVGVLTTVISELASGLEIPQAIAMLLDESGANLQIVAEYLSKPFTSSVGTVIPNKDNPAARHVLEQHQPLAVLDAQDDPVMVAFYDLVKQHSVTSTLLVPLIVRGRVLGAIGLNSTERREFSHSEIQLTMNAVAAAAQAVENARLYTNVQQLAITDDLTEIYNRRGLYEIGQREIERSRRFRRPLSAIMLDIDHFKRINDTYDHATGDIVLVALAALCRQSVREIDVLGRYGGEEFIILLPECDLEVAQQVAERLRKSVAEMVIPTVHGDMQIMISLGVTQMGGHTADLADLIARADAAMYQAKQAGRDRVVVDSFTSFDALSLNS